jgi:Ala-tRNA(Pro) deacylase
MGTCIDRLREVFAREGIAYELVPHPHAATSQEASAAVGISGYRFAKSVVVMIDERPHLCVLRAADRIDTKSLSSQLATRQVRIAFEYETHPLFPGCESGSLPAVPFNGEMPVYMDGRLAAEPVITFEAGSSTEAVRMAMADYRRLVRPSVLGFADQPRRQRRRVTRSIMWRRRAMQAGPFVAAISAVALGPRVMGQRNAPVRSFALGVLAGAATSTLADARVGGRRRALLRDKPARWLRQSVRQVRNRSRYMRGRIQGLWHRTGGAAPQAMGGQSREGPRAI